MIDARVQAAHLQAAQFLAARKAKHLDFRMEADPPADPPKNDPPAPKTEATDDDGNKLGFPAETPTDQMSAEERANYWRNQSKVQQKKVPANLSELQDKAKKWDDYQRTQQTPEQRDQQAESDRIRREAGANAAEVSLRAILQTKGKKSDEIDDLLGIVDFTRFLSDDGKVDTSKVTTYVNRVAPGAGGNPSIGQGQQGQSGGQSRGEAGKAAAEARYGKNSGQQSRYGALSRRP